MLKGQRSSKFPELKVWGAGFWVLGFGFWVLVSFRV